MKRFAVYSTLAVLIVILSALITQCYAQDVTTSNCRRSYLGGTTCTSVSTSTPPPAPPRAFHELTKAEQQEVLMLEEERDQRIAKWEAFCKPVVKQGVDGISRYTYAHKNCDLGRSE